MPFQTFTHEFRALGTDIWIELVVSDTELERFPLAGAVVQSLAAFYARFEKIFSRFDPASDLSRCNNQLGTWQSVAPELIDVAKRSITWHRWSHGYFDPRILDPLRSIGYQNSFSQTDFSTLKQQPIHPLPAGDFPDSLAWTENTLRFMVPIDFSGIAKGFITDQAVAFLEQQGFHNFLLDSGGDMRANGHDEVGHAWNINIEHTTEDIIFHLSNRSIATSGITRRQWHIEGLRFHHLINPHDPTVFAFDLLAVTVIAPSTEMADIQAKTLFLMGQEEGFTCAEKHNIPAVFLQADGSSIATKSTKKFLTPG